MDQAGLRAWEAKCIQDEPPRCQAGCPLEVDCRGFLAELKTGNLKKARTILEKRIPLPEITARLCEAPCEQYCLRKDLGGAINVAGLERYCIEHQPTAAKVLRLPPKPKKVLIIGGGLSSLTAAFDLAKKGYPVTLCHTDEKPGARLWDVDSVVLPEAALQKELQHLNSLKVIFRQVSTLSTSITDEFEHDAVFIGQDDAIDGELLSQLIEIDPVTFAIDNSNCFTGGFSGPKHPYPFITAVFQGRQAALSIDRYLQGASLTADRPPVRKGETGLYTNTTNFTESPRVNPQDPEGYTKEEATLEAQRCFDCQCLECVNNCLYLQEFGGYPKSYARQIYNNSAIVKGVHQANLLVDSCSLCGQCTELCPNDFSMADLCLQARQQMVDDDRMPPSAHWFALEEMRSANSEGALIHHAAGTTESHFLFYPGCQLAGIRVEQTIRLYDTLLELEPQTGIWLDCCGAPAHWAGRKEEFSTVIERLEQLWKGAGSPQVVTACSTCLKMFNDHLPQIRVESIWNMLPQNSKPNKGLANRKIAVSDPCTARYDKTVQQNVRGLLKAKGYLNEQLVMSGNTTECCGFGGLMENANPDLAIDVAANRANQTDAEIITYCAMCRDQLARSGKPVSHLLDILYPETAHAPFDPPARLSDRRINRRQIIKKILARYPEEQQPEPQPWEAITLSISATAAEQMEQRRILEDDIRQVLFLAKEQGHILSHGTSGIQIASMRLGEVTFWLQYTQQDEAVVLERCWSHRMKIKGRVAA